MQPFFLLFPLLLLAALVSLLSPCAAQVSHTALSNEQPVLGSLPANATALYTFTSAAVVYQQTALISVSASVGAPTLYVSLTDPVPSASSFNYSASWQTGGAVSVVVQPPYTAYVAVVSSPYSRCNYSVVATAYDSAVKQTVPIPLSSAVPLASAIGAGEYRYYMYNVTTETAVTTVALTEAYGQSYLLLNSPANPRLPTVSGCEYSSNSPTFPLVALAEPTVGMWTVGVWSNQSSAFSIIAADSNDTQPMELAITYPGFVQLSQYNYYSIYLDPLEVAANSGYLDLELLSLTGDADLYCSNLTTQPTARERRWYSVSSQPVDRISIPASQLPAGTIYCGVFGYVLSTYLFSASYASAFVLTAGETVAVQTLSASSRSFSLVFPHSQALATLSVVSDVGTTVLYTSYYGQQPSPYNTLTTPITQQAQLDVIEAARLCGSNNELTIPGSSPPLCQLNMVVDTSTAAMYRISASTAGQAVQLTAGEPVESSVSTDQPANFQFTVPDNLSNATLIITATTGASDLMLTVGTMSIDSTGTINALWRVAQQPGSNVIVFQLDWTDPRLPYSTRVQGEYAAVLSAATGPATFSVVYSVTNGSVYSDSIVQLLDGVPQEAVVAASNYNFFYFTPPADGWPYSVTVTASWTSGFGTLRVISSHGPQVGPLAYDPVVLSGYRSLTVTPDLGGICNPTVDTLCGWSISVQGPPPSQQEQAEYTITVTSGHWERTLYADQLPQQGGVLAVADSDYWQTSGLVPYASNKPQLLFALSVMSGSIAVFVSNVSQPNVTYAQMSWSEVSSAAVLSFPLTVQQSSVYLTVTCASTDGTACQYTLQVQLASGGNEVSTLRYASSSPATLLVPAGGIRWVAYSLYFYTSAAYTIVQATATVGTPSLYASCFAGYNFIGATLPNETHYTWQAVTAPIALELNNLDNTNCTYILLGVRATSDSAAQVALSVAVAGTTQDLYINRYTIGLSTPAYPTSYFVCPLSFEYPAAVLMFTLRNISTSCATQQLQMAVSDSVPHPNLSDPATYNISRSAVSLPNDATDLTIAFVDYGNKTSGLHPGNWYVAVQSTSLAECEYSMGAGYSRNTLQLGQLRQYSLSLFSPTYITFAPVPYNTSASLALRTNGQLGILSLYVGVDSTPSPADSSSYLLSALYDTTLANSSDVYVQQSVYVPASACSSLSAVAQACTLVLMASVTQKYTGIGVLAMSAADASWLLPNQTTVVVNATSLSSSYQFSLPSSPLSVTLTVNTSSALTVWCSYQYVTPDATFHEWQWQIAGDDRLRNGSSSAELTFIWANTTAAGTPSQLTNPGTKLAAAPTTCYCTVQAASYDSYSIAYSNELFPMSTVVPSTAAQRGLSRGALIAAVVVPIVAVLLLLAGLAGLWMRRAGGGGMCCCADWLGKDGSRASNGSGSGRRQRPEEASEREVSMAELSHNIPQSQGGRLMKQQWHSDGV